MYCKFTKKSPEEVFKINLLEKKKTNLIIKKLIKKNQTKPKLCQTNLREFKFNHKTNDRSIYI